MKRMDSRKLVLIDGNALFYRGFYALPQLRSSTGQLTNAIFGFMSMLMTLLLKENPEYILIAWDSKTKTFRHEQYADYKGTRPPPPEGLYEQFPTLQKVLEAFAIKTLQKDGYEADDILATVVKKHMNDDGLKIQIATGDRDLLQLVSEKTHLLIPEFGFQKYSVYDPKKVEEKFGVRPDQIGDYKSLVGDPSDNIHGVKGIGPEGAKNLLQKYQSLKNVYEHLEEIPGKIAEKLKQGKESAFFSQKLIQLESNTPVEFDLENCKTHHFNIPEIERIFENLEFKSLLRKVRDLEKNYNEKRQNEHNDALPLIFE